MTGLHLKALKDFALMEYVQPKDDASPDQTDGDACETITWIVTNLKIDPQKAIDNSAVELLEHLSMHEPEVLKFSLYERKELTPEILSYVQQRWQQRKLPKNRQLLASSNNPFNCVAIGVLFMSTSHLFSENDHAVQLVAAWLHVASVMVEHGKSPTFFTSLGVGEDNALPDIFCDVNVTIRSSTNVTAEPLPVYLAMETLGEMILMQQYRPSLSNVLQMACIVHRCSERARSSWTQGASGALKALSTLRVHGNTELRNGLPQCAFSKILSSSHDKILASLCVGVLSGNQRGNAVAPCVPLLITHGKFAALRTCMLKWIVPPDLKHSLMFTPNSDKNQIEVSCVPPQHEHAWLRDLYLLNATRGTDGAIIESFNVYTDLTNEGTLFAVQRGDSVYQTTPTNKKTTTWECVPAFESKQYIQQKVTHQTLFDNGVQTLPLLAFNVYSKDGSVQTIKSGIETWKSLELMT